MTKQASERSVPNRWGGGAQVCVPGLGVGRVVQSHHPRVVEVDLPVPDAAVFVTRTEAGPQATVLVDPRMPAELRDAVIEDAHQIEASAVVEALSGSAPMPLPTGAQLRDAHGAGGLGSGYFEAARVGR